MYSSDDGMCCCGLCGSISSSCLRSRLRAAPGHVIGGVGLYHKGWDRFRQKMGAEPPGGGKDWKPGSVSSHLTNLSDTRVHARGRAASPPPRVWVPWGTSPHMPKVIEPSKRSRDLDKGLLVWHTQLQEDFYAPVRGGRWGTSNHELAANPGLPAAKRLGAAQRARPRQRSGK